MDAPELLLCSAYSFGLSWWGKSIQRDAISGSHRTSGAARRVHHVPSVEERRFSCLMNTAMRTD